MASGTVGVEQAASPDRLIDNEVVDTDKYRQRVRIGGEVAADLAAVSAANGLVVDPSRLPAGEIHLGEVGGRIRTVLGQISGAASDTSFARPADTAAYVANDAVSNSTSSPGVIEFPDAARVADRGGYIVGGRMLTDQVANTATFRLHLFRASPSAVNDNAAQGVLWANRATRIGLIEFTMQAGSTAAYGQNFLERIPFDLGSGDTSIFGLLQTRSAFTPASGQLFYIELQIDQT